MRLLFKQRNRVRFPHSLLTHAYFKQRLSLPVYCVIPLALDYKVECVAAAYFRAVSSLQPALPA